MSLPFLLLTAVGTIILIMSLIWLIQLKTNNAGIVDVAWSYNFSIIVILYSIFGNGFTPRKLLITLMVVIWSLRLGTYLLLRVMSHWETEDKRYTQLRMEWKDNQQLKMFGFFQFQGILNVLLSLPFLILCINPAPRLNVMEYTGMSLWLISLSGEALADYQLSAFKKNPAHKNQVCDTGLWKYSRHPNYFFEWMIWISFFLTALGSPYGWISIICPLLMYYFLTKVTGIPMAEEQSIKSKGDQYRKYQQKTSAFIPWFRKN